MEIRIKVSHGIVGGGLGFWRRGKAVVSRGWPGMGAEEGVSFCKGKCILGYKRGVLLETNQSFQKQRSVTLVEVAP